MLASGKNYNASIGGNAASIERNHCEINVAVVWEGCLRWEQEQDGERSKGETIGRAAKWV